jgi:uncharacterized membrane protein YfhO
VQVLNDSDNAISTSVDAQGGGYLVVADALQQPGWSATVDGRVETLRPADEGMVAVHVPAGVHVVKLAYSAPGQRTGLVLSAVGVIALVAVLAVPAGLRRRRRPEHRHRGRRPA